MILFTFHLFVDWWNWAFPSVSYELMDFTFIPFGLGLAFFNRVSKPFIPVWVSPGLLSSLPIP